MPICAFDIAPDGSTRPVTSDVMPATGYRWMHFDRADPALEAWVAAHVPEVPGASLLQAQTRPRCDRQDGGLILNLRGVNLNEDGPADQMVAVRLWVHEALIVTVRMRKVFALDDLRKACDGNAAPKTTADFLHSLSHKLTARAQTVVFELANRVEEIEEGSENDHALPDDMGALRRQGIRLLRYLGPQKVALNRLPDMIAEGSTDASAQREVANQTTLLVEELESLNARLAAVHDEHHSTLNAAQNQHAYTLSIVAGVFLPLGFLTGLFGVNVAGMPGLETPWAFAALCAVMVLCALVALVWMRLKRWI